MNSYFVLIGSITSASSALELLKAAGYAARIVKINDKNNGCGWAIDSDSAPFFKIASFLTSKGVKVLGRFPKT